MVAKMMMMMMMMMMIIIIIIIIIGARTHRQSWSRSGVSTILRDSCLLPTNSLFPASLHPFPHRCEDNNV
jgi:hypothetical protein